MANPTPSDLQKSVESVNPNEVAENLTQSDIAIEKPKTLTENQKTPFIDESVRTDK